MSNAIEQAPQSKVRKVSAAHSASQSSQPSPQDLPSKISELEKTRQGPATLIQKSLLHAIPVAIKGGVYALSENETAQSVAERLSLQIEDAVYKTHPDKEAYVKQNRSVSFNLKQNQELSNRILTGALRPDGLAVMTTDEMATKEMQRETAEMQARVDKQSILITDDAPRVRRTHKGEELVAEPEVYEDPSDYKTPAPRRRSMLDPNAGMAGRSRETSPTGGDEVELPANIEDYKSTDNIRANATPKTPLNIDTKPAPPARKPSTPNDFDINKVFSSVQSPVAGQHARRPSSNLHQSTGPGVDPEIDKMLQDDNESPPYSPAEYSSDPDVVWQGTVTMDAIASFPATAKHVGGADLSRNGRPPIPWSDLLPKDLRVAGRIDQDKANEYLCSLRYSQPTDLVIVAVNPVGVAAQGWQDTINYFHSKHRYGVFANKGLGNIRDTYLIPVPPSPVQLPDFITNLEGHKLPLERTEPMMLFALIIRSEYQSDAGKTLDGAAVANPPSRQMSISSNGPHMSPINPQGSFQSPTPGGPQTPQPGFNNDTAFQRYQQEEQRRAQQREGEAVAAKILGPFINSPTVHFLMPQAFQMRPVEWEVIREILEKNPKAQQDLAYLSHLLENKKPE